MNTFFTGNVKTLNRSNHQLAIGVVAQGNPDVVVVAHSMANL